MQRLVALSAVAGPCGLGTRSRQVVVAPRTSGRSAVRRSCVWNTFAGCTYPGGEQRRPPSLARGVMVMGSLKSGRCGTPRVSPFDLGWAVGWGCGGFTKQERHSFATIDDTSPPLRRHCSADLGLVVHRGGLSPPRPRSRQRASDGTCHDRGVAGLMSISTIRSTLLALVADVVRSGRRAWRRG